MIVDLVRNDLSRVSVAGLGDRAGPAAGAGASGTRPPRVVRRGPSARRCRVAASSSPRRSRPARSRARPKLAALDIIDRLEPASRDYYCGAFGWVDADTGEAELAVAIRTFWLRDGELRFGTGAGITWGSDAACGVARDGAEGCAARPAWRPAHGRVVPHEDVGREPRWRRARRGGRRPHQRARPRLHGGRRRVRDAEGHRGRAVRADAGTCGGWRASAGALGLVAPDDEVVRAAVADVVSANAGGGRRARTPAHHLHGWCRAARERSRRRGAHAGGGDGAPRPRGPTRPRSRRCRGRATSGRRWRA